MSLKRITDDHWEWMNNRTHYSLRLFPESESLIWAVWVESSEGPQFGDGIRQTFDRFLEVGVPDNRTVPDELIGQVKERIDTLRNPQPQKKRGWQFWKR